MSLNTKFVGFIFLSSLLVFSVSTLLEVYQGYLAGVRKIESNLEFIERSYLKPVALSLYNYNQEELSLLLDAIQRLDGVASCSIIEGDTPHPRSTSDDESHIYDLEYIYPSGKSLYLGRLEVKVKYDAVNKVVWNWLSVRLVSLFIALCLLAVVVSMLFRRFIATPLARIANFASEIDAERINSRLPANPGNGKDELGKLVKAINEVLDRLESGMEERDKARKEILLREEAYRKLVENANDAIYIVQDGAVRFCNQVTESITGYSAHELSQIPISNLVHPDDKELVQDRISRRLRGESLSPTFSCLIDWQERPAILCFLRDLSEEKNLRDQLVQSQKMDSIGRLAGGVAHDLNNLLTPILGYAELLGQAALPAEKQQFAIEQIANAGKRARDLVRQLLAFSRKQTFEFKPVDINSVISGLEELFYRTVRESIEITVNKGDGLSPILGDVSQLEQVVMNLIVNASDAMPDGGKLILETSSIELDELYASSHLTARPGSYLRLTVSDTGTGMDQETCEKIYEPFFTTKGELGTGLGLSTVYGIVKQHGGFINFYSEQGKGTTFHVYLPLSDLQDMLPTAAKIQPANLRGDEKILLAEDNEQVMQVTLELLQSLGYTVLAASSGAQAVEIFNTHAEEIDLLLTDIIMPNMNGKELYETLKERREDLKVVYMSGYTSDVVTHHGIFSDGAHFIHKPFTTTALASKVRSALDD